MNEQHTRLDLMGIRLSVDLEGDFSFHGWPYPLPVYDVVTKRAENQVSRRRESASGGQRNSYRSVNSSRAVQGGLRKTQARAVGEFAERENAAGLPACRGRLPGRGWANGASRDRSPPAPGGWRNTAAIRRPEGSRSPLRFQKCRLLYVKRLARPESVFGFGERNAVRQRLRTTN